MISTDSTVMGQIQRVIQTNRVVIVAGLSTMALKWAKSNGHPMMKTSY